MNFQSKAQQECYDKVAEWLPAICDRITSDSVNPNFSLQFDSINVLVEVKTFRESESIIYIWAGIATEVEVSSDLLRYLLHQNDNFCFGGFSMVEDGDIRFHVTLLGASCQQNEFKLALAEVLDSAGHYDDLIVQRWGGHRSIGALV
ncbi:T3SS (YopN, CesT) and YbjN peptide-binding chaperone 1 [Pseudanabaena mucicola]|uniref:YbjN domain-containing protein n=1 Tax=Pseudanabaena mucicola FACHB-723 TaxID=2692860 RepID=A0ABR7ZZZ6_9CYAN|nr:YbjN domain-containing protein [Pseudanabaena mucicola]MBD2188866.1 YbjN domain-containing protein [Pseudanabaena mucicola FACHB-723]